MHYPGPDHPQWEFGLHCWLRRKFYGKTWDVGCWVWWSVGFIKQWPPAPIEEVCIKYETRSSTSKSETIVLSWKRVKCQLQVRATFKYLWDHLGGTERAGTLLHLKHLSIWGVCQPCPMMRRLWWSQQGGARQSCGLERVKTISLVLQSTCCSGESMTPTRQAQRRAGYPRVMGSHSWLGNISGSPRKI